jgi:hypothetical protein
MAAALEAVEAAVEKYRADLLAKLSDAKTPVEDAERIIA